MASFGGGGCAPGKLWLAIESVDSPGNLGTILRTAEAADVAGVFLVDAATDPHDPAAVRASMGSLFCQTLIRCTARDLIAWASRGGVCLLGSAPQGLIEYRQLPHRWPAALLVGGERRGLSPELLDSCHFTVRIPMAGRGDSLNAAVATGILLYELFGRSAVHCR